MQEVCTVEKLSKKTAHINKTTALQGIQNYPERFYQMAKLKHLNTTNAEQLLYFKF